MVMSFDFKRRLVGLQDNMEESGLDLVVYGSCQNFQYLTGLLIDWRHWTDLGSQANNVFVPRKGEPILTVSEEWAKQAAQTWVKDVRVLEGKDNFEKLFRKVLSDLGVSVKKVAARAGGVLRNPSKSTKTRTFRLFCFLYVSGQKASMSTCVSFASSKCLFFSILACLTASNVFKGIMIKGILENSTICLGD
jgi:Xaa-Pro aminopeptidase